MFIVTQRWAPVSILWTSLRCRWGRLRTLFHLKIRYLDQWENVAVNFLCFNSFYIANSLLHALKWCLRMLDSFLTFMYCMSRMSDSRFGWFSDYPGTYSRSLSDWEFRLGRMQKRWIEGPARNTMEKYQMPSITRHDRDRMVLIETVHWSYIITETSLVVCTRSLKGLILLQEVTPSQMYLSYSTSLLIYEIWNANNRELPADPYAKVETHTFHVTSTMSAITHRQHSNPDCWLCY